MSEIFYNSHNKTSYFSNLNNSNTELLIYGGENNRTFLGCINCSDSGSDSIWNLYSGFGSEHDANSIWNEHGEFSGIHGKYSPFNKYSSNPPILVDRQGNFYGYFTADEKYNNRTKYNLASYLCDNWKEISDNQKKFYNYIFE